MRLPPHDGHSPRPLHENATRPATHVARRRAALLSMALVKQDAIEVRPMSDWLVK
jgi:hypothetical protein